MRTPIISPIRTVKPASIGHEPHRPGDNIRGASIMCLSMLAFGCNDAIVKFVAEDLPLYQVITLRGIFVSIAILIVAPRLGGVRIRLPRSAWQPMAWRSVGEVASTLLFLNALHNMAIGDLSAIMQSLPLVIMVAAALFFGETLGWRRISAAVVGMIGVLLILRPGTSAFGIWSMVALGAMLMVALRDLATRYFSREITTATIAFYAAVGVTLAGLVMSFEQGWETPNLFQLFLIATSGSFLTVGYVTAVSAMRIGEISYVAPFRYTSLLVAIILGLIIFGDWPDLWTWLGSALVVGAGLYTIIREVQIGKVR